jgi:carbonic anhydrase/acetyltransferase-like protein (isoleucine patch superfamily)
MPLILTVNNKTPQIHPSVFIAENAVISGDVLIEEGASVWYGCVLRGDLASIKIGKNTNIQDNTVIHVTRPFHIQNKTGAEGGHVIIGENVTVGHSCVIHAGNLHSNTFVGMGSIIMDLSILEQNSMVAAGTLLTAGKVVPQGELWSGSPAKFMRKMREEEISYIQTSANNYNKLSLQYKSIKK